jgi:regulator of sirC expression with transglutaminase-like and TPR domain
MQPADASFRKALAITYERLQKKSEAAAEYAEYLRLSPDAADAEKVRARIAQLAAPAPVAGPPPAAPPSGN